MFSFYMFLLCVLCGSKNIKPHIWAFILQTPAFLPIKLWKGSNIDTPSGSRRTGYLKTSQIKRSNCYQRIGQRPWLERNERTGTYHIIPYDKEYIHQTRDLSRTLTRRPISEGYGIAIAICPLPGQEAFERSLMKILKVWGFESKNRW